MEKSVIYSLKPVYAHLILNREKIYELRKVIPRIIPKFIWFYVSAPESKIMYLAEVGEIIKFPSNIKELEEGEFAYPILHFYKIKNPINLNELKEIYNFNPPQSFTYLKNNKKLEKFLENCELDKIY